MYSRNVKISTTRISSGSSPRSLRAQSLGLCGSGVSQAFQHGEALNPQPTAAPCPLRGVDAGQSKG